MLDSWDDVFVLCQGTLRPYVRAGMCSACKSVPYILAPKMTGQNGSHFRVYLFRSDLSSAGGLQVGVSWLSVQNIPMVASTHSNWSCQPRITMWCKFSSKNWHLETKMQPFLTTHSAADCLRTLGIRWSRWVQNVISGRSSIQNSTPFTQTKRTVPAWHSKWKMCCTFSRGPGMRCHLLTDYSCHAELATKCNSCAWQGHFCHSDLCTGKPIWKLQEDKGFLGRLANSMAGNPNQISMLQAVGMCGG